MNMVGTKFSDRNVFPGSTKYVDVGTSTWRNHSDLQNQIQLHAIAKIT